MPPLYAGRLQLRRRRSTTGPSATRSRETCITTTAPPQAKRRTTARPTAWCAWRTACSGTVRPSAGRKTDCTIALRDRPCSNSRISTRARRIRFATSSRRFRRKTVPCAFLRKRRVRFRRVPASNTNEDWKSPAVCESDAGSGRGERSADLGIAQPARDLLDCWPTA